jgi:hypothetical protein
MKRRVVTVVPNPCWAGWYIVSCSWIGSIGCLGLEHAIDRTVEMAVEWPDAEVWT